MTPPSRDDMPVAPVADSRPEGAGGSAEAQKTEVSVTRADLEERMAASITRREFIVGVGATLVSGLAHPSVLEGARPRKLLTGLPEQPNIVLIITDQERYPQYWPNGWTDANLPNRKRLSVTGITFTKTFCNSCMCSPSRSTLFTGLYPSRHGVMDTLTESGQFSNTEQVLPLDTQNLAKLLKSAGYNVVYKGKWHMSKPTHGNEFVPEDAAAYGFDGWDPPDAGEDTAAEHFGGGRANNDGRFTDDAVRFLKEEVDTSKPFALIVSLVNPHDVLAYPSSYQDDYNLADFPQGIDLPPTINEDLSTKPSCQKDFLQRTPLVLGALTTDAQRRNYVNFYAYLHKVVDQEIGRIIDAIEAPRGVGGTEPSLRHSTIIIRTSDHGEMGLSHGGLRQKAFNVYEESIRVSLVFSNPTLFPSPVTSDALVSLVDVMPTVATIAKVDKSKWEFQGADLSPILADASAAVQDAIHFIFDDQKAGNANVQSAVPQPNHIRCIREHNWKYAIYFDPDGVEPTQYEMYDLANDPTESINLANSTEPAHVAKKDELHQKLLAMMERLGTTPPIMSAVEEESQMTSPYRLFQNYPNPFNASTTIPFSLNQRQHVALEVIDVLGRHLATLVDGELQAGEHAIIFDAGGLSSGVYFYRLRAGNFVKTRKFMLQK